MRPHLEVVGHHEILGDAFAEYAEDELLEIMEALEIELVLLGLDQSHQALEHDFLRQILDVVLERVGQEAIAHPYPGLAEQLLILFADHLVEQAVEVFVVREENVSTDVVGETIRTFLRRREPADFVARFEHHEVFVAELPQTVARAESGGTGADDHDFLLVRHCCFSP